MPARSRRPGQSWQTFLRNQAMAFIPRENYEERSRRDASPNIGFDSDQLKQSEAAQILPSGAVLPRGSGRSRLALNNKSIRLRSISVIALPRIGLPQCPAAHEERSIVAQWSLLGFEGLRAIWVCPANPSRFGARMRFLRAKPRRERGGQLNSSRRRVSRTAEPIEIPSPIVA
jgi:hypothetical protein